MKSETFQDKVCVITGAASGIGRALAVELAGLGAKLALSDVNMDGLDETRAMLGQTEVNLSHLDVSDAAAIAAYPAHVLAELGPADFVFNVAGLTRVGEFKNTPLASMETILDVNYWGVVRMTKGFLDQLIETKGTVVNISSLFGLIGYKGQTHYCASKFAVRGFTETLALEMADYGVGVCSVHPGGVATNIARNAEVDYMPNTGKTREEMDAEFDTLAITTADKAARTILEGAARRKLRIIVGADAKIASFIQRVFPQSYTKILNLYTKDKVLN
ncbi:SDR family NAD(P)-dependent oxidoreductase [Litorimonas sp. RW-G-Af-16]|uniref:SDR family NAD(P)-dependent oxidoreductase n=1 Tax=Litorimonas sp. RW-G-Af-16 TaxID=3241168 RepID=UPI00390C7F7F